MDNAYKDRAILPERLISTLKRITVENKQHYDMVFSSVGHSKPNLSYVEILKNNHHAHKPLETIYKEDTNKINDQISHALLERHLSAFIKLFQDEKLHHPHNIQKIIQHTDHKYIAPIFNKLYANYNKLSFLPINIAFWEDKLLFLDYVSKDFLQNFLTQNTIFLSELFKQVDVLKNHPRILAKISGVFYSTAQDKKAVKNLLIDTLNQQATKIRKTQKIHNNQKITEFSYELNMFFSELSNENNLDLLQDTLLDDTIPIDVLADLLNSISSEVLGKTVNNLAKDNAVLMFRLMDKIKKAQDLELQRKALMCLEEHNRQLYLENQKQTQKQTQKQPQITQIITEEKASSMVQKMSKEDIKKILETGKAPDGNRYGSLAKQAITRQIMNSDKYKEHANTSYMQKANIGVVNSQMESKVIAFNRGETENLTKKHPSAKQEEEKTTKEIQKQQDALKQEEAKTKTQQSKQQEINQQAQKEVNLDQKKRDFVNEVRQEFYRQTGISKTSEEICLLMRDRGLTESNLTSGNVSLFIKAVAHDFTPQKTNRQ